jgi:prolyl-tRNA synthetase
MPEGKALQGCTSHDLGQNFSKAQNIMFQDKNGQSQYVWQNSWGFTTRAIGGMLMAHGDDAGLVLPPRVAPIQVVILTVRDDTQIINYAEKVFKELQNAGIRTYLDKDFEKTIGYKINEWEIKGVPVRLEIGAREASENTVTVAVRHSGEKTTMALENFLKNIKNILDTIHEEMYKKAEKSLNENTYEIGTWDGFKKQMDGARGFIKSFWCEDRDCETKIKEETKATTRCLPLDTIDEKGSCVRCGKDAKHKWIFAQAY